MTESLRLIRRRDVLARTTFSNSELYRRISAGTFPTPIPLGGGRRVAWSESEVDDWIAQRLAEAAESKSKAADG